MEQPVSSIIQVDGMPKNSMPLVLSNPKSDPIDVLERAPLIEKLLKLFELLSDTKSSTTFALNGKWGSGKSFLLTMLEKELARYEESGKYAVFHYNCWQYDYYEEPLPAIVSAMLDYVDEETHLLSPDIREKKKAALNFIWEKAKEAGAAYIENKIGVDILEVRKDWAEAKENIKTETIAKYQFDKYRGFSKILSELRKALNDYTKEQTLIVIVDELDRCLPTYAIKVLERLHHIFSEVLNTIVLLAIDSEQLNYTVEQVFGSNNNKTEYLRKFINFTINLENRRPTDAVFQKYEIFFSQFVSVNWIQDSVVNIIFTEFLFEMSPRLQDQIFDRLVILHNLLPKRERNKAFALFEFLLVCKDILDIDFNYRWVEITKQIVQGGERKTAYFQLSRKAPIGNASTLNGGLHTLDIDTYEGHSEVICKLTLRSALEYYREQVFPDESHVVHIEVLQDRKNMPAIENDALKNDIIELKRLSEFSNLII